MGWNTPRLALFAFILSRLVFLFCDGTAEIGSEFNSILVSNSTFTRQMNHVLVSLKKKKKYLK